MVRPTALGLTVPLSRAKDVTPLASVLHALGTRSRLETLQLLMDGPKLATQLPARSDELQMLRNLGVVRSEPVDRRQLQWMLVTGALDRIAEHLRG